MIKTESSHYGRIKLFLLKTKAICLKLLVSFEMTKLALFVSFLTALTFLTLTTISAGKKI